MGLSWIVLKLLILIDIDGKIWIINLIIRMLAQWQEIISKYLDESCTNKIKSNALSRLFKFYFRCDRFYCSFLKKKNFIVLF